MQQNVKLNGSRILFLCSTDNMVSQFLVPHIKDLQNHNATVDIVCAKTGFWFDKLKETYNFNMIEMSIDRLPLKLKNYKAYKQLLKLQKQNNYNLIFCQQPIGGMLGRFVGRKCKIPVIYTAHGFFFFKGNNPIKNLIFKFAEKTMSRWSNTVITMNDEDFNATKKFHSKHIFKISGIGLDLNKYDNSPFNKLEFKKSLGLNESDKVIVSVAELIKRKNYETMIKTFANLSNENPNLKYVICGTGSLFDKIVKLSKKLKVFDKVKFLGYRADINKILQISDIFFHQSLHEGLTMSLMEAMYFGLPVVTSNVRGNADLISNKGGIITPSKDIAKQCEALKILLEHPKLAQEMGEHNQQEVKKYSLEKVRKELNEIYKLIGLI